jgi:ethanolamine utilization protein EutQ
MSVRHFSSKRAAPRQQAKDLRILLADVLDASNSDSISVGFARYGKDESNERIVTYDEALIVTKGVLTVRSTERARWRCHRSHSHAIKR